MSTQRKKISLTLQLSITIDDSRIPLLDSQDEGDREYAERQQRLLRAILSGKKRLHDYLQWEFLGHLESMGWQEWYELLMGDKSTSTEDVLAPAIATLNPSDRDFFDRVADEGIFLENTEDATLCFSTELEQITWTVEGEHE